MSRRSDSHPGLFDASPPPAAVDGTAPAHVPMRPGRATTHHGPRLCVLGSGSGGNCSVVTLGGQALLIDAGFGPLTITRRLQQAGVLLEQVRALCLTHLDQDHFRPHWVATLRGFGIHVYLHRWHADDFARIPDADTLFDAGLVHVFEEREFEPLPGMTAHALRLSHDQKGTSGFHLAAWRGRIGYATDLGHVPDELVRRFAGVDVLAIESNYDPPMQLRSPRPLFLKRRIMGHAGHLCNEQAFAAVRGVMDLSPAGTPRHVVLLHRSQQCNDPAIIRDVFGKDDRLTRRVTLTEQRRRSQWFDAVPRDAAAADHPMLPF
ncbi:MAG: MBL fold metallo-hydrolase [Planctomycetes bacterium]|nr:MBL fold metallo-hydrolase [Planctomycetota bacterium]